MKNNNYPSWLVPLEIAKELKEIGFDMVCQNWQAYESFVSVNFTYLDRYRKNNYDVTTIPTWEQVFEWFREKGMFHSISIVNDLLEDVKYFEAEICDNNGDIICIISRGTYEEAREELVNKLIELYGNNK